MVFKQVMVKSFKYGSCCDEVVEKAKSVYEISSREASSCGWGGHENFIKSFG